MDGGGGGTVARRQAAGGEGSYGRTGPGRTGRGEDRAGMCGASGCAAQADKGWLATHEATIHACPAPCSRAALLLRGWVLVSHHHHSTRPVPTINFGQLHT